MKTKNIREITPPAAVESQTGQDRIAPGTCRIVGRIMEIFPDLDEDKSMPCGQVPCKALVRVQQVKGFGAAFPYALAKGQEIKVYFSFTLAPAQKLFPELTVALPGLKTGSLFIADVQGLADSKPGSDNWFKVNTYKIVTD